MKAAGEDVPVQRSSASTAGVAPVVPRVFAGAGVSPLPGFGLFAAVDSRQPWLLRPWTSAMTVVPPLGYALRPIAPHERELAYTLTREAMRSYVEQTWGAWIEVEQRERHALTFNPAEQDFILQGGEVVGLRALRWRPTDLFLARLYLRPQAQGKGLGSAVLGDLLWQARAIGRSVELQVLKVNDGAQRFYARHGFERVGELEAYWLMRAC